MSVKSYFPCRRLASTSIISNQAALKPGLGASRGLRTHAGKSSTKPSFAFDIDGVLTLGSTPHPRASKALSLLRERKLPFILMTNGGGWPEVERAKRLEKLLGLEISPSILLQSHTPFSSPQFLDSDTSTKEGGHNYRHKPILVMGGVGNNVRQVAEGYGYQQVYTPIDFVSWFPSIWPFAKLSEEDKKFVKPLPNLPLQLSSIFMYADSRDWGRDIQIVLDVLTSKRGIMGTSWLEGKGTDSNNENIWRPGNLGKEIEAEISHPSCSESGSTLSLKTSTGVSPHPFQIPLHFSNPDFLWGNEYPFSRFGQGGFRTALEAVWERRVGMIGEKWGLGCTTAGKPTPLAYDFAERMLRRQIVLGGPPPAMDSGSSSSSGEPEELGESLDQKRTYMIGDNPYSDIQGANARGWKSILVRTGVFRAPEGENHHEHKATKVVGDVLDAVQWALKDSEGS